MAQISNIKLPDSNNYGIRAGAIPYGEVDATSTATAFTATVPGIKELVDGTTVLLRNGQITSASGFTLNVNGLGAKPCYNNMATGNDRADPPTSATRDTTIFNAEYTMLFVYSTIVTNGGGWICYRGYDSDLEPIPEEDIDDIFDMAYDVSDTTWVFNSTISPKVPQANYDRYWNMNFYCDGQPFTDIRVHTYTTSQLGVTTWTFEIWYVGQSMQIPVYTGPNGWTQNQYKTIIITSENIKGEIYAFLCENAVQEGGE